MTIIVVHATTPQGQAALEAAAAEALRGADDLIAVSAGATPVTVEQLRHELGAAAQLLDEATLAISVGESPLADPSDAVVQIAQVHDARLIVIGLRRRTPVGKLLLGSTAQRILLEATCPVLAVKA